MNSSEAGLFAGRVQLEYCTEVRPFINWLSSVAME